MNRHFALVLLVAVVGFVAPAGAQEAAKNTAPFGLTWGMSSAHVRQLGADLTDSDMKDYGISYSVKKLPKVLSDVEIVLVSFGYDDKLWRVAAISREFDNDPYGSRVMARYTELAKLLSEKYGRGATFSHRDPDSLGPKHLLFEIHSGRAWEYTNYETDALWAQLGIGASSSSNGFWRLICENKALRRSFELGKAHHEKEAL